MSNNKQIAIAVAVIVILAVFVYAYWIGNPSAPVSTPPATTEQSQ